MSLIIHSVNYSPRCSLNASRSLDRSGLWRWRIGPFYMRLMAVSCRSICVGCCHRFWTVLFVERERTFCICYFWKWAFVGSGYCCFSYVWFGKIYFKVIIKIFNMDICSETVNNNFLFIFLRN